MSAEEREAAYRAEHHRNECADEYERGRAEARRPALDAVRERVVGMYPTYPYTGASVRKGVLDDVLAALDAAREDGTPKRKRAKRIDWADVVVDEGDEAP